VNKKFASESHRYQALLDLLRTAEGLWNACRVFFSRWDLSPSQFNVLNLLADQPEGLIQSQISERLIMHRSNATGLIDRLEKRGLVRRNHNPEDRRVHRVVLTAEGRKLLEKILPDYYRLAEKAWDDVPISQTRQLLEKLSRLNTNIGRIEHQLGVPHE
jgi:MarR family 2-MHQ and catechol resistance regulon transcriptional repressor